MSLALTEPPSDNDNVAMFEDAYKRQPQNEELAMQTFFAQLRTGNWKASQQVSIRAVAYHNVNMIIFSCFCQLATKMSKQFNDDRFLYWAIMCTVLQVGTMHCNGLTLS